MGKLNNIDKAAAGKGSGIIPAIKALSTQAFHWFVFDYPVIEGQRCGLALFIAFNVSNLLAQIVAFFINKEKTFNSGSNTAITLPIYIIFTLALVCFSAWFNPVVFEFCTSKFHLNSGLSLTIATAVCSALQFFLYFPVDKNAIAEIEKAGSAVVKDEEEDTPVKEEKKEDKKAK